MSLSQSIAMMGNQNKSAARPFSDKLRTLLYQDSKKRLNAVIGALLAKAESGDIAAIKEIADRIEGKVSSGESSTVKIVIHKSLNSMQDIQAIEVQATQVIEDASP